MLTAQSTGLLSRGSGVRFPRDSHAVQGLAGDGRSESTVFGSHSPRIVPTLRADAQRNACAVALPEPGEQCECSRHWSGHGADCELLLAWIWRRLRAVAP